MSITSQQTRVLTQNPPLLAVWVVASFRTFYAADLTNVTEQAAAAGVTANQYAGCYIDSARDLAFVGDGVNVVYSVDIADALNPTLLDSLTVGVFSDRTRTSVTIGDNVYAVNETANEVYVIDASVPSALVQIHDIDLLADFAVQQQTPVAITARGNFLYVVNYDVNSPPVLPSLLNIIDVSDPLNPVQVATVNWGVPANDQVTPPSDRTGSIQLFGNYAYALVAGVLHIVNVQDPANPVVVSDTPVDAFAFKMAINSSASQAVIIGADIQLWTITNLSAPSVLDTVALPAAGPMVDVAQGPHGAYYITFGNAGTASNLAVYTIENDQLVFQFVTSSIDTGGGAALGVRPVNDYTPQLRV